MIISTALTLSLVTLSFQERFTAGKMQDTSCAFYKIQQILVKNPRALSQEEVISVRLSVNLGCRNLSSKPQ